MLGEICPTFFPLQNSPSEASAEIRKQLALVRDPAKWSNSLAGNLNIQLATTANHLERMMSLEGEPLPEGKFIRHVPNTVTGIPIRRGLARPAAWAFLDRTESYIGVLIDQLDSLCRRLKAS